MGEKFIPKPFQRRAVREVVAALGSDGRALLVSPTGSGKTEIFTRVIEEMHARHRLATRPRTLVLSGRVDLVEQTHKRLRKALPNFRHGLICGGKRDGLGVDPHIVTATVPGMAGETGQRIIDICGFDLVVIDEAHHAPTAGFDEVWRRVLAKRPDARLFGATATPERADGKGLEPLFGKRPAAFCGIDEVLASGLLVPWRTEACELPSLAEIAGVEWNDNADNPAAAARLIVHVDEVVRHYLEQAGNRLAVFFCADVDHAEALALAFRRAGVTSEAVSHRTKKSRRRELLGDMARGRGVQVLTSATMLIEGVDMPPVSCVGLVRGFVHLSTLIQAIGRGLRRSPSKVDCLVLDMTGVSERHPEIRTSHDLSVRQRAVKQGVTRGRAASRRDVEVLGYGETDLTPVDRAGWRYRSDSGGLIAAEVEESGDATPWDALDVPLDVEGGDAAEKLRRLTMSPEQQRRHEAWLSFKKWEMSHVD